VSTSPAYRPNHLSADEVADYLKCSPAMLHKMRKQGSGPAFRIGKRTGQLFYVREDVDSWINKHRHRLVAKRPTIEEGPTELYRHYDVDGNLLYVGISLSAVQRLANHRSNSHWYDQVDTVKIERHPSRKAAEAAELEAIRTEKLLHNVVGRVAA
jgi:hypothetical protein